MKREGVGFWLSDVDIPRDLQTSGLGIDNRRHIDKHHMENALSYPFLDNIGPI
jgi:hypothetical protein